MKTKAEELIVDAAKVERRPWRPLGGEVGVGYRPLWVGAGSGSYAGVMRMDPGASIRHHAHAYAVHHMWVLEGECAVGERTLEPGAYAFVPAGVEHGIDSAGPEGCTFFYLYLRASLD
ncbi:MAG TPA: cupin domain-containing protein [Actinomycetota bacterium]